MADDYGSRKPWAARQAHGRSVSIGISARGRVSRTRGDAYTMRRSSRAVTTEPVPISSRHSDSGCGGLPAWTVEARGAIGRAPLLTAHDVPTRAWPGLQPFETHGSASTLPSDGVSASRSRFRVIAASAALSLAPTRAAAAEARALATTPNCYRGYAPTWSRGRPIFGPPDRGMVRSAPRRTGEWACKTGSSFCSRAGRAWLCPAGTSAIADRNHRRWSVTLSHRSRRR